MGLIHDITPDNVSNVPAYLRGFGRRRTSKSEEMVSELYRRGVTIEDIFGMYYAMEEMAGARDDEIFGNDEEGQHGAALTVGDALLVTPTPPAKTPLGEMPF